MKVAGQPVTAVIRRSDMDEFATFDSSRVWNHFPPGAHVLSIHGLADTAVPP